MDKIESGSPPDEPVRLARWSAPRLLPAPVNSDADEYYPMALKNGTLYFGAERKGCQWSLRHLSRRAAEGQHYMVENIGPPINTAAGEYEAFRYRRRAAHAS